MIKKLRIKILESVKSKKINIFILFLLSAFVILIFTKLSKEYTNTINFEIEKLNVPQEKVILNDSVALNITLKTHGFKWLKYYVSKPKIKVDFTKDVYNKQSTYVWSKSKSFLNNTQFDKQVELLNISPDTLIFRYDVNLVKKVPVKLNAEVNYSPGYNTSKPMDVDPDSITVIGPNVLVSKINYLETKPVKLDNIKTDLLENIALQLPDNYSDLKFSKTNVTLKATVEKFTEGTLKIPLRVINIPEGVKLKYFPKDVNVSYYVSLNNFKSITAKDFRVICDYEKHTDNQSFLIPELTKAPEDIKNVKLSQQRIEFIITK